MGDDLVPLFMKIGLTEQKAKETAKNKVLSKTLSTVVNEAETQGGDLASCGSLLYNISSKTKPQILHFMPLLVKYVCAGKLDSEIRLNAAIDYLLKLPPNKTVADVNLTELESNCGVGIVVTPAQIEDAVEEEINKVSD